MSEAAILGWRQFRIERKQFWRNPTAAFFNFVLPIVFLLIGEDRAEQGEEEQRQHEVEEGRAGIAPEHLALEAELLPRQSQRRHSRSASWVSSR